MSQKRKHSHRVATVPEPKTKPKSPRRFAKLLSRLSPFWLLFFVLFLFAWGVYGPVFRACEEHSFFVFDAEMMRPFSALTLGWLRLAGRFVLLSFHYPFLGALVLAALLATFCFLASYAMGRRAGWLLLLPPVLTFGWLFYMVLRGYDLFYQHEPSLLFMVPLAAWAVAFVAAAVRFFASKDKGGRLFERTRVRLASCLLTLVLGIGLSAYAWVANGNIMATCRMQKMVEQGRYNEAIDLARSRSVPNRGVAAYYAMALNQLGSLPNGLFDIFYQFPIEKVRNAAGNYDDAITIYSIDGNFYAGLPQTSYHDAMERMVVDGPSVFMLKRLCRAALAFGDYNVARKYAYILSLVPFEGKVADDFRQKIAHPELIAQDPTYSRLPNLLPVKDAFEQAFRSPIFIGYNVELTDFRTVDALNNSIAACLYTKLMPQLIERAELLRGQMLPAPVEQALLLRSYSHPELGRAFGLDKATFSRQNLGRFAKEAMPYFDKREAGAQVLRAEWLSFYPYYYYFENQPPKQNIQYQKLKEGGVN